MRYKIAITIFLMLLMLTSAFSATSITKKSETWNKESNLCPEHIEVTKMIWNGAQWVDYYESDINEIITFNITITYNKNCQNGLMATNIVVTDTIPEDFTYVGSYVYNESYIVGNLIYWELTEDYDIVLYDNESVSIIFEAQVNDYGEFVNLVEVFAWEVNCAWSLFGSSSASIYCSQPTSTFEKTVWDPSIEEWVDFVSSSIGETLRFKIELTYYGNYNLQEIKILDQLPCCLVYDYNANITETYVSEDLKTIWWNFTEPLENGETLSIEFDTLATDASGCTGAINSATVFAYENQVPFTASDTAEVEIDCYIPNYPPCPPVVIGDTYGKTDEVLTFKSISFDPEEDNIFYMFDWGDESYSEWLGPYSSGTEVETTHSWASQGVYNVKAKAKDIHDAESSWSYYPLIVTIDEAVPNDPPSTPIVTGDVFGKPEDVLTFKAVSTDPEEDDIFYMFDWDDGNISEWEGPYASGTEIEATHYWILTGKYNVTVKAKDENGKESDWSDPLTVTIDTIEIEITISKKLFIGRVGAKIQNTGNGTLENISWKIDITKAGVLRKVRQPAEGTIEILEEGDEKQVWIGKVFGPFKSIKLRVGRIQGTVTASVGGYSETIEFKGLILGRIILIRSYGPPEE
jgi:hypothetical protein